MKRPAKRSLSNIGVSADTGCFFQSFKNNHTAGNGTDGTPIGAFRELVAHHCNEVDREAPGHDKVRRSICRREKHLHGLDLGRAPRPERVRQSRLPSAWEHSLPIGQASPRLFADAARCGGRLMRGSTFCLLRVRACDRLAHVRASSRLASSLPSRITCARR